MNRNELGRKALMGVVALITVFLLAACGGEAVSGQASMPASETVTTSVATPTAQPQYVRINQPTPGNIESLWDEVTGEPIEPTGFVADFVKDLNVDGPFYGPAPTAGDFDAAARVGIKCIAFFKMGGAGSNVTLMTDIYVEDDGMLADWSARDGTEGNPDGANRLIAHFRPQCD